MSNHSLPAFPRMSQEEAADRVRLMSGLALEKVEALSTVDVSSATYYQTATDRIRSEELGSIQKSIRDLAASHGYPTQQARGRSLAFDQGLTVLLGKELRILPADAADEGVWSFLTLNVNPEVALWRFPNNPNVEGNVRENYERLVGRPRNVFRRAWWRGYVLSPALSSRLLEDESVGIMERPSIGGSARLAQAVAAIHLEHVDRGGVGSRQDLLRDAIKRLRRNMGQISIHALNDQQLQNLVADVFQSAREKVSPTNDQGDLLFSEIQRFRELTADLWPMIEPNVVEVDWSTISRLMSEVVAHRDSMNGNSELAAKIVGDLERLVADWAMYTSAARAVVHGAVAYFLDLNDDVPDHLPAGLDDDDEVVGAAYSALDLLRE